MDQDCVEGQASLLAVLNLWVLLAELVKQYGTKSRHHESSRYVIIVKLLFLRSAYSPCRFLPWHLQCLFYPEHEDQSFTRSFSAFISRSLSLLFSESGRTL